MPRFEARDRSLLVGPTISRRFARHLTVQVLGRVDVRRTRAGHQDMGDVQIVEHGPSTGVARDLVQYPGPHPPVEGDRVAGTILVAGPGRVGTVLQRRDDLPDRRRRDTRLIGQQHHRDARVGIVLHHRQACPDG